MLRGLDDSVSTSTNSVWEWDLGRYREVTVDLLLVNLNRAVEPKGWNGGYGRVHKERDGLSRKKGG